MLASGLQFHPCRAYPCAVTYHRDNESKMPDSLVASDPVPTGMAASLLAGSAPASGAGRRRASVLLTWLVPVLLVLSLLVPGSARAGSPAGGIDALLAPYESGAPLPPVIDALPLPDGRAYAVLAQIMPPYVATLQDPNSVRRAMLRGLNLIAVQRAGTQLGHALVGWRCADGRFGLTGKVAREQGAGLRMLLGGWGMAALISDFKSGEVHARDGLYEGWLRGLRRSAVRVVAFEIGEGDCQRMRRALADYLTHPQRPADRFSSLRDPAQMRGDCCFSFALWLAGEGGVFAGIPRDMFWREVVLRDSFIGEGTAVPAGVVPFRVGKPGQQVGEVGLLRLMLGDWNTGRKLGRVRGIDPELMTLALDRAYARARQPRAPRLSAGDAQARELAMAVDRWLGRYGRITPLRMGEARAVVLHRR